jgi:hypothetical protein
VNTIYCDFYEICGTATYVPNQDLEYYNDGYQCAECFDQLEMTFFDLFERDEFRMQSRMADAEMGDL